jgi:DNA-binding transcriptional MocR family regulator
VVLQMIRSGGLDACLARLNGTYSRRCDALCEALRAAAATTGWQFVQPSGGYFLWLRLPADVPVAALLTAAKERGAAVLDGARCCGSAEDAPTGGVADAHQHVRLCFAYLEEAELRDGVARLAAALADARGKPRLSPL